MYIKENILLNRTFYISKRKYYVRQIIIFLKRKVLKLNRKLYFFKRKYYK